MPATAPTWTMSGFGDEISPDPVVLALPPVSPTLLCLMSRAELLQLPENTAGEGPCFGPESVVREYACRARVRVDMCCNLGA